jgi:hypothetical protein
VYKIEEITENEGDGFKSVVNELYLK